MGRRCTSFGVLAATAVLAAGLAATATAAPLEKSTFTDTVEGWKVVGDTAGDPEKPDHIAAGGSPGGFAQVTDLATGGVMYWRAPAKYRGNQIKAYKGELEFTLTQSACATPFEADDLVLEGANRRIVSGAGVSPAVFPAWTNYTVLLTKHSFEDVTNPGNEQPATKGDMRAVLGDLDDLYIRAEYCTGDDTDGLDTVKLKKPAG